VLYVVIRTLAPGKVRRTAADDVAPVAVVEGPAHV
jgi:hypothetical protein